MDRRAFVQALGAGCTLLTAGCVGIPSAGDDQLEPSDVVEDYWYERTELVVQFRDDVDIDKAVLLDSSAEQEYETIEDPPEFARFPVVFPDRLETHLPRRPPLRVRANTQDGWTEKSVWEPVHGAITDIEIRRDGCVRFTIENQGKAPLLVRFVGVYGDVPNPTVDPQSDSFDRSTFDIDPSVIGVGKNRPLSPSRTDLVVSSNESVPFETTYAPFAFPDGADTEDCRGLERTAQIAIVYSSGGSAAYTFTFRLDGSPAIIEGHQAEFNQQTTAEVCSNSEISQR